MMLEGPAFHGAIGRLADPALNLAAWGLTMSLSLLIESPVIMLLGTSVALCRDGPSFRVLQRFMILLCVGCTAVTGLVAFTPLFDLITVRLMGQPQPIVDAARPAMRMMLLWTAAIGWRRFYQGVLVRYGRTRLVTYGTAIRLASAIATAAILVHQGRLAGVQVAAAAVMAAVLSEAAATTLFSGPVLKRDVLIQTSELSAAPTLRDVWHYHMPLAATTLLTLLAQPLTTAALARLPNPALTLAAWPVAFMVLLVMRGGGLAYQEITVATAHRPEAAEPLRRTAWLLGWAGAAAAVAIVVTPALGWYLSYAVHAPAAIHDYAASAVAIGSLTPLLTALGAWARGNLMAQGRTREVYRGMVFSLAAMAVVLIGAVQLRVEPMAAAAGAMTVAVAVEFAYLAHAGRRAVVGPTH